MPSGRPPRLRIEGLEPNLEKALDAVVRTLLEKEPLDRPQDAATVASVLRKLEPKLPDPGPPADLLKEALANDWDGSTLEIPEEDLRPSGSRSGSGAPSTRSSVRADWAATRRVDS